jgi:hypothetical protein
MAVKKYGEEVYTAVIFLLIPNDENLRKMKIKEQVTYFLEVYQSK